jgi:hypothetical protein
VGAGGDTASQTTVLGLISVPKTQWWVVSFVTMLCFSSNQKSFSIYSCLRHRTTERWQYVVKRAYTIVVVFYIVFGVLGYLAHLSKLARFNFLLDFDGSSNLFFDTTRAMFALWILLSFPVDCLVASTTLRRVVRTATRYYLNYTLKKGYKLRVKREEEQRRASASGADTCDDTSTHDSLNNSPCSYQPPTLVVSPHKPPIVLGGRQHTESSHSNSDDETMASARSGNSGDSPRGSCGGGVNSAYDGRGRVVSSDDDSHSTHMRSARSSFTSIGGGLSLGVSAQATASSHTQGQLEVREERRSSVGDISDPRFSHKRRLDLFGCSVHGPGFFMVVSWLVAAGVAFLVEAGVVLAATIGGLSTAIMVFILPSMLYFRMGVASDFQSKALFGTKCIYNQFFMTVTQVLGVIFLVGNVTLIFYTIFSPNSSAPEFNNTINNSANK